MSASSSILANRNQNMRRNNSSIQVITAPLNDIIEEQQFHQQQQNLQPYLQQNSQPQTQ
jgi:hypothetical protein